MANEKPLLGKNEILFIYGPIKNALGTVVAAAYFPIGCLTSNDLSKTIDMKDGVITKCDSSPPKTYGSKSYEISFEAVAVENDGSKASYDAISAGMDAAYLAGTTIFFKIETTLSDATKKTEFGKGYLTDLSRSAPAEDVITFSGTIQGVGELSATDLKI